MKNTINILDVTPNRLHAEKYQNQLPELYELKNFAENNSWHNNQNVFDHAINVFEKMIQVLKLDFLTERNQIAFQSFFDHPIKKNKRKEILLLATLLHDIAKSKTLVRNKNGETSCPGHEIIGSVMAEDISVRFGIEKPEIKYVADIILYHGFSHQIVQLVMVNKDLNEYLKFLNIISNQKSIELLLLAYADMLGSDVNTMNPQLYSVNQQIIIKLLEKSAAF